MKALFLGTSSGITSRSSFHSSYVIYGNSSVTLFDAGDGVARALLMNGVNYNNIDSIVISHFHPDHFSGLASLIIQMKLGRRTKPLKVFVCQCHRNNLITFLEMSYLFVETMNFDLQLISFDESTETHIDESMKFFARRNSHILNKHELEKPNIAFKSHSFVFTEETSSVFVTSDLGSADDLHLFDDLNYGSMIAEATHINIEEMLSFAVARGLRNVFISHYDDDQASDILAHIGKISQDLPSITLAKQGLLVEL